MRLQKLTVFNFRGYREATTVSFGALTSVVGRNDVGKSTLLEALAIFFNCEAVKVDAGDLCVHNAAQSFEIACAFDDLPNTIVIDTQAETTLAAEHLLNEQGQLEIVKRYDCTGTRLKVSVWARAHHPTTKHAADLIGLKIADLRKRAAEVGVDMEKVDKSRSSALRHAIWSSVGELGLEERLVPLEGDEMKKVWEQIQSYMPTFALFQADRPSKDEDAEVQDPMKIAVTEALKALQPQLDSIREQVRASAMAVAERTLEKLREMDERLADELRAEFRAEPRWDGFKLALHGADGIPINKRGSGVRRLILLNFFRADAERRQSEKSAPGIIYAVEEPETSQHPSNQALLIKALQELSQRDNVQVVLTTHVPGIAGMLPTDSIRFVRKDDTNHPRVLSGDDDVLKLVADDLGVLPDNRVRVLVCVEGPHDVSFLERITPVVLSLDENLPDLTSDPRIAFVLLSGGNLKHWVAKNYLEKLDIPQVHIYDRDESVPPKYQQYVNEVNARGNRDWATLTAKREMESYLHHDAIKEGLELAAVPAFNDADDVPLIVAEIIHSAQVGSKPWAEVKKEDKKDKSSKAKARLNTSAVEHMNTERLLVRDPHGEVVGWFRKIGEYLSDAEAPAKGQVEAV